MGDSIPAAIPAATVVLVRDGDDGLETLMLRRNAQLSFGGMWVFPGGRIDPEDGEGESGARRAAVREALEEAAVVVKAETLVPFARWIPPPVAPKRFDTSFFLAPAPPGAEVAIDMGEIHDHIWTTAEAALARHAEGDIELAPPTWVTLHWLAQAADVESALAVAGAQPVERYETHMVRTTDGGLMACWLGDVAYEGGDPDADGPRHRLRMTAGRWVYERTM